MKICWDNLEQLKYNKRTGKWYTKGYTPYIYMDSCKTCKKEYLTNAKNITIFYSKSCSSKNKKISKNQKQKNSKTLRDKNYPKWKGGIKKNISLYNTYFYQFFYDKQIRRNKEYKNILEIKYTYCGKDCYEEIYKKNTK